MTSIRDFTRDETDGFIAHLGTPAGAAALSDFIAARGTFNTYAIEWRRRHLAGDTTPIAPPEQYAAQFAWFDGEVAPTTRTVGPAVVEHGLAFKSGDIQVRWPGAADRYPVEEWIADHRRHGGRVLSRTVIVVEDWHEVPSP